MDYRDATPHNAASDPTTLTILKQDSQGFYIHDMSASATSTVFSRLLTVTSSDDSSFRVTATVSWNDKNNHNSFELVTILYDWR
jgi:hypothetical protein